MSPTDDHAAHAAKVERVARQLRAHARRGDGKPVSLRKKAVSHQVPKRDDLRRADDKIDVSDLDAVLAIDPDARVCVAEPGITFTDLVYATMKHGLVPKIVPELRTITIGGAVSGCSLESSSFKYGGFHDTCLEYEVVTAAGDVLRCTPRDNALVFQMMHGSFGTLGVLTKLVFELAPAKRFVHLEHLSFASRAAYEDAIVRRLDDPDVDFMDGFIHARDRHVLSVGRFVDDAPYTSRYDWLKVYFESTARRREDYLRTPDYFFRYDNGVTNVHPRTALGRFFLGKFLHSSQLLRLADKLPMLLSRARPDVIVDLFLPLSRVDAYLDWHDEALGFYPLWVVPYRRVRDYEWIDPSFFRGMNDRLFVDLAIYGLKQPPGRNVYKEIEDALARIGGIKTLISYNYYDEETFWTIFNRTSYDAVKRVTDPQNVFRDLYDKTCRAARGVSRAA